MEQQRITDIETWDSVLSGETEYFRSQEASWSLAFGPQPLELVAHALRVVLHIAAVEEYRGTFGSLAASQRPDGGWGSETTSPESGVWVTAFCALMLIRGNRLLKSDSIERAIQRAIDFFLERQQEDGRWIDPPIWTDLDATSHPVSFFHVVRAFRGEHRRWDVDRAWARGLRYIVEHQDQDGGWYAPHFRPSGPVVASGSPIEMTAHLLQDSLVADLLLENRFSLKEPVAKAIRWLKERQAEDGSWDRRNSDHTMDSTRSLMLASRTLGEDSSEAVIERAIRWILAVKQDHGWGDFPGDAPNLERLCDGLDTLLKFGVYRGGDPTALAALWGFVNAG